MKWRAADCSVEPGPSKASGSPKPLQDRSKAKAPKKESKKSPKRIQPSHARKNLRSFRANRICSGSFSSKARDFLKEREAPYPKIPKIKNKTAETAWTSILPGVSFRKAPNVKIPESKNRRKEMFLKTARRESSSLCCSREISLDSILIESAKKRLEPGRTRFFIPSIG